jgi:CheY-like chemotaxis protein
MSSIEQAVIYVNGILCDSRFYHPVLLTEVMPMNDKSRKRVLLVDDDSSIREAVGMLLNEAGYEIVTAADGFEALARIKLATPDVIVSDLNMPRMSGYEFLSVVRMRFSSIPVIAMSGDYDFSEGLSGGVHADAFFAKGRCRPEELMRAIAELVQTTVQRPVSHTIQTAAAQMPWYGEDSNGAAFMMLTCTECLRPFPLSALQKTSQDIQKVSCPFCVAQVWYSNRYPASVASPALSTGQGRQRGSLKIRRAIMEPSSLMQATQLEASRHSAQEADQEAQLDCRANFEPVNQREKLVQKELGKWHGRFISRKRL